MIVKHKIVVLASVFGLAGFAGCTDSGANAPTTVTVRPNKSATPAADGAEAKQEPAAGGAAAPAEGVGSFKGRVVLTGSAPQLPVLVGKGANIKDAEVCAVEDVPNEKLVVGKDNGVANVFVYLSKAPAGAKKTPPPTEPMLFDQKHCRFFPHALVIRVGQPLQIVSDDGVNHNTHIIPGRSSEFNQIVQSRDRKGVTHTYSTFENEPAPVKCDFHGWMSAFQLPLDHPYAAVTNENGEFEIKDLPAGQHRFSVWHEGAGFLNRGNLVVTVKPNETATNDNIQYDIAKFKP